MKIWKSWKYKNLTIFVFSLIIALLLSKLEVFHNLLLSLGNFGYVSALFAGFLFVSSFTISTGILILLVLAERLHPVELGIIAGLGAVVGDLTIFHIVRDDLEKELELIYQKLGGNHLSHVLHTKYFSWTFPLIGALIIASPLPDEIGVSLMGISKMNRSQFMLISFVLNSVGIFLVVLASTFIKP